MINISYDEANMQRAIGACLMIPKEAKKASISAINRTLTHVRKSASVHVRERYLAKAAAVKKSFTMKKASSGHLAGVAISKGTALPLTAFKITRPKRGPMRVKVLRSSSPKPVRGLFVGRFPKGYEGPMMRTSPSRYPLKTPFGPSIPIMIGNDQVVEKIEADADKFFNARFAHEVDYRLSKWWGG